MFKHQKALLHIWHVYGFSPVWALSNIYTKNSQSLSDVSATEKFVAFPVFWWMSSSCVFFIAGFVQLDIKVIVVRTKNCMSSNHTFLSIARNGVFQFLILKQYEKWQKQAIIVFSISCNSQKCLIRDLAIFSSCNYYLYVQMEKSCNEKNSQLENMHPKSGKSPKKICLPR